MPACPACGVENPERAKFCLECGTPLSTVRPQARESRRTVTVLFSDVVGSTALGELLDPEAVHAVMTTYFAAMQAVIERHGGTVEKFIGDAIMAVFGLPILHEDDALRAVRAAADMRDTLATLNTELEAERSVTLATRTGLNTGEVLAGDPSARQSLVTGDAVNTAARLEQAAGPGEILIGRSTWMLVRDLAVLEPVAAVGAKGKAEAVPAFRLISVGGTPDTRILRLAAPLLGRDAELGHLTAVFEAVVVRRTAALVTVLGPAGIGKSRLVTEFIDGVAEQATVLHGRCLSYGEGITYWPLRDILHAAVDIQDSDAPAEGWRKLDAMLQGARDGPLLAARLASAVGLTPEAATQDEIFWAVRRAFEHLARDRPLVIAIDDIHWAEPTFLELLEHVADESRGASILIIGSARPDLLEAVPRWAGDRPNATTLVLAGLAANATASLMDALPGGSAVPPDLRARIVDTADGNPLFIEEMVRMLVEDGIVGGTATSEARARALDEVRVPPTIQALMAARLDRLPREERAVAQRASVVGRVFEQLAVIALTPQNAQPEVRNNLLALVRKELISPEPSSLTEEDAFKFRHILARDAAYDALPKSERAELHERFADWLERAAGNRAMEYEEILGYHLGQAHGYRTALRVGGPRTERIGRRAIGHLAAAARRARDRGDAAAAVRLYRQTETLPRLDPPSRAALLLDYGLALFDLGRIPDTRVHAEEALSVALEAGDRRLAARARLLRLDVSLADGTLTTSDPDVSSELVSALADAEASGDERAMAEVRDALARRAWDETRFDVSAQQLRRALGHARAAGDERFALDIELQLLIECFASPSPADEVFELARGIVERGTGYPTVRAQALAVLAVSEAMLGRSDDARADADESVAVLGDLAQHSLIPNIRTYRAWVDRLSGDLAGAEAHLRRALAEAEAMGDMGFQSFVSCRLAEVLVGQGRFEEATVPLAEARRDPIAATRSRIAGAQARISASRGDPAAATEVEGLLDMVVDWPWLNVRTEALIDAAQAMLLLGDQAAARDHAREALRLCEAKGNVALGGQVEALLTRLSD